MTDKFDARYGTGVARKVPPGRVLAHNHVRHTVDMLQGLNGFRWWTWPKEKVPSHFIACDCGYAGLPHVALETHADHYKCEPWGNLIGYAPLTTK